MFQNMYRQLQDLMLVVMRKTGRNVGPEPEDLIVEKSQTSKSNFSFEISLIYYQYSP